MNRHMLAAIVTASVGGVLHTSASPAAAQIGAIPGWRMVWTEEFRGTSVDSANWTLENVAWPHNAELQFYLPQQASVANGQLKILAERRNHGGRAYVSARMDTQGKFSQQYGRFEARMKLPLGKGYWPAFWLLPESGIWPPEIDIMEHIGSQPNTVLMTQHWGTVSTHQYAGGTYTGPDFTAGFHQFAAEWSPTRIDWFVDGVLRYSTTTNVPQMPMYVVLNLAVGGFLPGNPDGTTVFPGETLVDWVRVYQRDQTLVNPSFESPSGGGGGAPTSWALFGNAQQSTQSPLTGTKSLRVWGTAGNGPFYSGAFQDLPATAGQVWRATANGRHLSSAPLVSGNQVVLKIEWYGSAGQALGFTELPALTNTSPTNTNIFTTLDATAPAGTATARVALVFVQTGAGTGNAYFDDVSFTYISPVAVSPCVADFDENGGVNAVDLFGFLDAWFAQSGLPPATPNADIDRSGLVDATDLFMFLDLWFADCP